MRLAPKEVFIIAYLFYSTSSIGQSSNIKSENASAIEGQKNVDTLQVLDIENGYKVFHLNFVDGFGDKIRLIKYGRVVADILLPVADNDVKNFSVNKIQTINNGLKLSVSWGGGNYFYERTFNFEFKDATLYLNKLQKKCYRLDSEQETVKDEDVVSPIKIDMFILSDYIENE